MIQVEDTESLRLQLQEWRNRGESIVMVPTMGNLHVGHLALVDAAREQCDRVVVSIFVNPTQFVQGEDYAEYPRTLGEDRKLLEQHEADLLFTPAVEELYPGEAGAVQVSVPSLDGRFCGASRPGHFTGVATVVTKLLNLVQPDKAIFGEKDYQQLLVIRKLVSELLLPVEILSHPTLRESDGLALSSRNRYLTDKERSVAPALYQVLCSIRDQWLAGNQNAQELEHESKQVLTDKGFKVDYLSIVSAGDLNAPKGEDLIILAAAWLGRARLIDNLRFQS